MGGVARTTWRLYNACIVFRNGWLLSSRAAALDAMALDARVAQLAELAAEQRSAILVVVAESAQRLLYDGRDPRLSSSKLSSRFRPFPCWFPRSDGPCSDSRAGVGLAFEEAF